MTNNGANTISVVDISSSTAPSQIATASVGEAPQDIYVSGRYAYVANANVNTISVVDISGAEVTSLMAHSAEVGNIQSRNDIFAQGNIMAGTSLIVGAGGIMSNGSLSVFASSTGATSSIFGIDSIQTSNIFKVFANGTVGIGTSTPIARLAVTGAGTENPFAILSSTNASMLTVLTNGNVGINTSSPIASLAIQTNGGINPFTINSSTAGPASTTMFTVLTNGNVGIATSSPREKLTVDLGNMPTTGDDGLMIAGNAAGGIATVGLLIEAKNSTDNEFGFFRMARTGGSAFLGLEIGSDSRHGIRFSTQDSTGVGTTNEQMRILANGNVGIGTTTPFASLSVLASSTNGNSPILEVASSSGASFLRVLASGNVGINTSTPTEKLSVVGNISNIISPHDTTAITQIATTSVGRDPKGIFISGRYAYTANEASSSISIVDISNPTAPVQIATTSVGSLPNSIFVSGRYAYVTNGGSNSISVVDISQIKPSSRPPFQVATAAVGTAPSSIYVSGRYAYVANSTADTISVVDISNPTAPVQIATTSVGTDPVSIYVSGRFAYVANQTSNNISIVDISNPSAPVSVDTVSVGFGPNSIYVSGRYAYVANSTSNTISVVDISGDPLQIATTSVGTTPASIYVSGRYAYVANFGSNNISIVDISSSTAPVQIATTSAGAGAISIYVSGRYAYTANSGPETISVIDISGTEVSSLMAHSAEVGNLQSRNDIFAQGNIMAGTGLIVGAGGIRSDGALSVFVSSTGSSASTSIFSISSAQTSNIFRVNASGTVQIGTSTAGGVANSYRLLVDAGASTSGGIGVNGFIRATGAISTNPLDLAEQYPLDPNCSQNGNCPQAGDVVCSVPDGQSGFYITKCTSAYASTSIGIVSGNPGFILGGLYPDGTSFKPVALAGRVPVKVTNSNGNIHIGDKLTSSNIPGVAMKATGEGQTIAIALGDYPSPEIGTVTSFVNVGWNNSLHAGFTIDTSAKTLTVGTSSNPYNLVVTGNISLNNSSAINKLSFATSTLFESNVSSFSGARGFIFNVPNFSSTSADNYLISLRSNNTPVFSVAANGDVHAKGNYYGASAVLGTSTNPGDLAERVDIAIDDTVEAGDVMIVDKNAPDTYRRSGSAYEQSVAGIISTNPTIIVGNGKTDYTAVMAMVGRVPVKVSTENGNIQRGDLLITASTPGLAMKYDPAKDNNNKMVAVIGVALESLGTSTTAGAGQAGKVLALIRTGWIYNRDQAIGSLQDNIQQIAIAQGIDLSSSSAPGNLNLSTVNGQLSYTGGNLDLQNNSIINVASITGKDNKWRIDEWGNLIQKIVTAKGDKETYGLQSSGKQEIVISGTSTLENGFRKVILEDLDQEIIDKTVPLKIFFSMSGETKGVYIAERSYDSFVVKENENGQSNASFDWTVIAKILSPEPVVIPTAVEESITPVNTESAPVLDVGTASTPITNDMTIDTTTPVVIPTAVEESLTPTATEVSSTIDISSTTLATP